MNTEEPIHLDHPEKHPVPPARRRLVESAAVLLLVILGVSVYRFGHAPEVQESDAEAAQEASFAALRQLPAPAEQPADPAVDPDPGRTLALIDQVGGETFAQARDGHYLFFGRGRRLMGYYPGRPKWPIALGASRLLAAPPRAIAVHDGFAYVALEGESGLHVLSVLNPNPFKPTPDPDPMAVNQTFEEVGTIALAGPVVAIAVDPAPRGAMDRLYAIEARGSDLVQHHLTVVDVADPRSPQVLTSTRLPFNAVDIAIPPGGPRVRNPLYLAVQPTAPQGVGGIAVMEDPLEGSAAPELLGFVEGISAAREIRIRTNAYVVGQPTEHDAPVDGVMQLDISRPRAPRRVDLDFSEMPGPVGPRPPGHTPRFGVLVADPESVSFWAPSFGMALSDDRLPETPTPDPRAMAEMAEPDAGVTLTSLDVFGDRMYAISDVGKNGSTLWNLQRPRRALAFSVAETFAPDPAPVHLAVDRDLLFGIDRDRDDLQQFSANDAGSTDNATPGIAPNLAGRRNGLRVQKVVIEDHGFPDIEAVAPAGAESRWAQQGPPRIAVDGDIGVTLRTTPLLGAVGHSVAGKVKVLDLSRSSLPDAKVLGEIVLTAPNRRLRPIMLSARHQDMWPPYVEPWDIALQDRFAYVVTRDSLRVIDIGRATEVGRLDGLHAAGDIAIDGGFAYVADAEAGLRVIDISRRATPRLVATLRPRGAVAVARFDGGLAVLDRLGGLSLFRLDRPGELELASRIEATEISPERAVHGLERRVIVNNPAHPATQLAAVGKTVFVAGEGFVWAARTDAPEIGSAVRDDQLLGDIQSIAAADGLLFVSDRRSGLLVFDHTTAR